MAGTLQAVRATQADLAENLTMVPPASTYVNNYVLVANVAQSATVPANARLAVFEPSVAILDFYVNFQGATAVVSGAVTDGSAAELNPDVRDVTALRNQSISIISPQAGNLSISYYS